MDASDERIQLTIAALKEMGVAKLGVSHCTGLRAACVMAREFGDRFFFNNAGTVINLPYGAQRRVEMARALASEPKILFLDEPTVGMTPEELDQMLEIIRKVHQDMGLAIYLIEHRLKIVMELCERIQTLVFGEVIAEGTPEEIKKDERVLEAYLGGQYR